MPRVSKEQTELNRAAIEEASAALFRERGFHGVSVSDLMAAAGLTHGGFYGHFESKEALAAIACERAFAQAAHRWQSRAEHAKNRQDAFAAIVSAYLTESQRDHAAQGCPAASFVIDAAREPRHGAVRGIYIRGIKGMCDALAKLGAGRRREARAQALVRLATMVGALVLSRATAGDPISAAFLKTSREALLDQSAH